MRRKRVSAAALTARCDSCCCSSMVCRDKALAPQKPQDERRQCKRSLKLFPGLGYFAEFIK